MIRYRLMINSVYDTETGSIIPFNSGGWRLREYENWVSNGGIPVPEKPGDAYFLSDDVWLKDIDEEKRIAAKEIRERYAKMMIEATKPYELNERETWDTQKEEARQFLQDPNSPCPLIRKIAEKRQITIETLVAKITYNTDLFLSAIGTILGMQQKELDDLN